MGSTWGHRLMYTRVHKLKNMRRNDKDFIIYNDKSLMFYTLGSNICKTDTSRVLSSSSTLWSLYSRGKLIRKINKVALAQFFLCTHVYVWLNIKMHPCIDCVS